MLDRSPSGGAEEFAILDFEGFGPWRLGEYESIATWPTVAQGIAEHGRPLATGSGSSGPVDPDDWLASRTPTSATGPLSRNTPRSLVEIDGSERSGAGLLHAMSGSTTRDLPEIWSSRRCQNQ